MKRDEQIIYYARNHIMSTNKAFKDKKDAFSYIGSAGIVETYKLNENYYYFEGSDVVGRNKYSDLEGVFPKFGALLPGGRIHKKNAKWLLGI